MRHSSESCNPGVIIGTAHHRHARTHARTGTRTTKPQDCFVFQAENNTKIQKNTILFYKRFDFSAAEASLTVGLQAHCRSTLQSQATRAAYWVANRQQQATKPVRQLPSKANTLWRSCSVRPQHSAFVLELCCQQTNATEHPRGQKKFLRTTHLRGKSPGNILCRVPSRTKYDEGPHKGAVSDKNESVCSVAFNCIQITVAKLNGPREQSNCKRGHTKSGSFAAKLNQQLLNLRLLLAFRQRSSAYRRDGSTPTRSRQHESQAFSCPRKRKGKKESAILGGGCHALCMGHTRLCAYNAAPVS